MSLVNSEKNVNANQALYEEQRAKINEVRKLLGPLSGKVALYCSDGSIGRYLIARNWNVKKATKMLKETLKWRAEQKPDEIRWDDIATEGETGKIYRTSYSDKYGRSILVMRPGVQNTKSAKDQVKYLVYCMENAILNLPPGQQQMVWFIDFHGFNLSHLSVKVTKDTAHVLQGHYPERLGLAILYNPPKIFESFWMIAKPFLEPKTVRKVQFVYSNDPNTKKIMEGLCNLDELEQAFGGNNPNCFNINDHAARMREDDKKSPSFWNPETSPLVSEPFVNTDQSLQASSSDLKKTELEMEDDKESEASTCDLASSLQDGLVISNKNGGSSDHGEVHQEADKKC